MNEFKNSFYNIAVQAADLNRETAAAQRVLVDHVTADAPILAGIPFEKASHAYHNVFERLTDTKGIDVIDFDGPLPEIDSNSQLDQVNLTPLGGRITFGEDRAMAYGSKEAYIERKFPPAMRESGMRIEKTLFCKNFLDSAKRWEKVYSCTEDPDETQRYAAMVAVTWTPGEVTGLFSPLPYQPPRLGRVFETKWVNGGNTFYDYREKKDGTGTEKILCYGAYVKTVIGMQLENPNKIAALVNIDQVPTPHQLVTLTEMAQANDSTRIYCSRSLGIAIASYYGQQNFGNGLIGVAPDGHLSVMGVPVFTSFNVPVKLEHIEAPFID